MNNAQPDFPEALLVHRARLETRLRELHSVDLDDRLYALIMRWMSVFERGQSDQRSDPTQYLKSFGDLEKDQEERISDRAQYLKTIDEQRALWAVKLRVGKVERFLPIIGHRVLKAPIDTLPMNAFDRYGRHLHYATKHGRESFMRTQVSIHRNYALGPVPFNFATYVTMCELVRSGKTEPLKYRVQGSTAHRLRLKFGNAPFPRTFYVLWNSDDQLIIGTLGRGIAESLVAT